jgi:hypothetical protein
MPPDPPAPGTSHGHPQVTVLDFTCDLDIAELITLMNACDIPTLASCHDDSGSRGGYARRIRVMIPAELTGPFLDMLSWPEEEADPDSITSAITADNDLADLAAYAEDRAWHYDLHVHRDADGILPLCVSIRFPYADLPEVTARLHVALTEMNDADLDRAGSRSAAIGATVTEVERFLRNQAETG